MLDEIIALANFTYPFTYHAMHFGMDTKWQNNVLVSLVQGIALLVEN